MKKLIGLGFVLGALASAGLNGQGQAPAAPAAPAGGGGRGTPFQLPVAPFPNRMAQGGSGPIKVLFVSKGHFFDRDGLMTFFDQLGGTINWTHVEQPAAQVFYDQKNSAGFDVLAFYDAPGRVDAGGQTPLDSALTTIPAVS